LTIPPVPGTKESTDPTETNRRLGRVRAPDPIAVPNSEDGASDENKTTARFRDEEDANMGGENVPLAEDRDTGRTRTEVAVNVSATNVPLAENKRDPRVKVEVAVKVGISKDADALREGAPSVSEEVAE
jgi:hypothetical protein